VIIAEIGRVHPGHGTQQNTTKTPQLSFDWLYECSGRLEGSDLTVKTIIFWPFILCDTTINLGLQKVRQNVVFRPKKY
jgi:hypothetical protein